MGNGIVKEYTIKGFTMDDERLKNSGGICKVITPPNNKKCEVKIWY